VFQAIRYVSQNVWSRNIVSNRRKGKLVLCIWGIWGVDTSSISFLTLALDGGERSGSRPGHLLHNKQPWYE